MKSWVNTARIACAALGMAALLGACGGGGLSVGTGASSPSTTTTTVVTTTTTTATVTTSTTGLYLTGISFPLKANDSVHVPAGTLVDTGDGTVTTINASTTRAINVPGGSIITVPAYATGPANILITTLASLGNDLATTQPTITSVAGTSTAAGPAVDGVGTAARFWGGGHLVVESSGNLLLSESAALKRMTPGGTVTTLVPAYLPYDWQGIAVGADGTVYGSGTSWAPPPDSYGATLQRMSPTGLLGTVASNWVTSPDVTTLGLGGLAVDSGGNLYFTESRKHRILKFTPAGAMSVLAGSGTAGAADAVGAAASFNNPTDLAIDAAGNLWVSDTNNSAIRKISPGGVVTTVARLQNPGAISVAKATGLVYVAAGAPRTVVRLSADVSRVVSFSLTDVNDTVSGLASDATGKTVYVGTQGVGAQILRLVF